MTTETETTIDTRPILDLTFVSGYICIGGVDLDDEGMGVRAYTLSSQHGREANSVMLRRFEDMVRLMGDNVQVRRALFATEDEANDEADHRNADEDCGVSWQAVFVSAATEYDDDYWAVEMFDTTPEDDEDE